jgi:methylated-DNA-[protein]-cysteine S-methyltransferase
MTEQPLSSKVVRTPVGDLTLVASDCGLRAVLWPNDNDRVRLPSTPEPAVAHPILDEAACQIEQYFAGARTGFDIDLDLRGTEFQVQVWEALSGIPYGETSTYGAQAEQIGRPTAVRAVGAANGRNPVSIVLPCHRIVGKDGSLTGFAGGLSAKRFLLDLEREAAGIAASAG